MTDFGGVLRGDNSNGSSSDSSSLGARLARRGLLDSAGDKLDIRKPWNAPKAVWRWAWNLGDFLTRNVLHRWDPIAPENTKVYEGVYVGRMWCGSRYLTSTVA